MSQFSNSNHPLALADNSLTLDRLLRVIICCVCFASGCVVILCVNVPSRVHSSSCRRPDALGRQSPSCWFSARHDCNDKCKRYMWHLLIDYAGRALKDSLTDWSHSAALNAAGGMPAHTHTCMCTYVCPFGLTRFTLMHFTLIVPLPAFILPLVLAAIAGYFLSVIARICHQL